MKESKIKKDNAFAEKLKSVLDDNDITMTQLANDTGITYNMVKKYCHGMAEPTISYALKIAETLSMVSSHQVPLDIHISNGTFLNHLHPQNTKLE